MFSLTRVPEPFKDVSNCRMHRTKSSKTSCESSRTHFGGLRAPLAERHIESKNVLLFKVSECPSNPHPFSLQSGAMDVVVLLEAFPDDVAAKDLNGNSSVHVAASAADYELIKVLLLSLCF